MKYITYCRKCFNLLVIPDFEINSLTKEETDFTFCSFCCKEHIRELNEKYNHLKEELVVYTNTYKKISKKKKKKRPRKSFFKKEVNSVSKKFDYLHYLENSYFPNELSKLDRIQRTFKNTYIHSYYNNLISFCEKQNEFIKEQDTQLYNIYLNEYYLDILKSSNVLNESFFIWFNGHFVSINGITLGSYDKLVWDDINSGLGSSVLLLWMVCEYIGFVLGKYKLVARGSRSCVEEDGVVYQLYYNKKNKKSFNKGLVALCQCVREIECEITKKMKDFSIPYQIDDDKLINRKNAFSIKCKFVKDIKWIKAIKYLFTDIKYLIIFVASLNRKK